MFFFVSYHSLFIIRLGIRLNHIERRDTEIHVFILLVVGMLLLSACLMSRDKQVERQVCGMWDVVGGAVKAFLQAFIHSSHYFIIIIQS